jgi:hypothetical protein
MASLNAKRKLLNQKKKLAFELFKNYPHTPAKNVALRFAVDVSRVYAWRREYSKLIDDKKSEECHKNLPIT